MPWPGHRHPTLTDLAWPNLAATAIAAISSVWPVRHSFAWAGLGERSAVTWTVPSKSAAYLSLAASWMFTAGFGVTPAWLGAGLVGYAIIIAIGSSLVGAKQGALWVVRISAAVGAALSLLDPGPTLRCLGHHHSPGDRPQQLLLCR